MSRTESSAFPVSLCKMLIARLLLISLVAGISRLLPSGSRTSVRLWPALIGSSLSLRALLLVLPLLRRWTCSRLHRQRCLPWLLLWLRNPPPNILRLLCNSILAWTAHLLIHLHLSYCFPVPAYQLPSRVSSPPRRAFRSPPLCTTRTSRYRPTYRPLRGCFLHLQNCGASLDSDTTDRSIPRISGSTFRRLLLSLPCPLQTSTPRSVGLAGAPDTRSSDHSRLNGLVRGLPSADARTPTPLTSKTGSRTVSATL